MVCTAADLPLRGHGRPYILARRRRLLTGNDDEGEVMMRLLWDAIALESPYRFAHS